MAMPPLAMGATGNDERFEPEAVAAAMESATRCVCVIEGTGGKAGTGTLIAPDLVLTNYHVVEPLLAPGASLDSAECRFDYRKDRDGNLIQTRGVQTVFKIVEVGFAQSPPSPADHIGGGEVFADDQLDYAIVRIESQAGRMNDVQGQPRGWITLRNPSVLPEPDLGMDVHILQHPFGEGELSALQPLKGGPAEFIRVRGDRARYIHNGATAEGSSGGPVFAIVYGFVLIALHNSSTGETLDGKKLGQAIPLTRIAKHILRFSSRANLILGQIPPRPVAQDLARKRADSIARRKTAALCLMDRSREENAFIAKLFAARPDQQAPPPLLHVAVCRDQDAPSYFTDRLAYLSFDLKPDTIETTKLNALVNGLNSAPTRTVQREAWPPPERRASRRMEALKDLIGTLDPRGRYLLLLNATLDPTWSPTAEAPLLSGFALMLASTFAGNLDNIQAVVFYIDSGLTEADLVAPAFADLWSNQVPPFCGACVELSAVRRYDLDAWRAYVERAWGDNAAFADAIGSQFEGGRPKPFAALVKGLDPLLSDYIAQTLDRIGMPQGANR